MKKLFLVLMLIPIICFAKPEWQKVISCTFGINLYRLKVPHGWLVHNGVSDAGITFYPDENHDWKIDSE